MRGLARPRKPSLKPRTGQVVTRQVTKTVTDWPAAPLVSTDADVALDLEHRQKGLLWYDTFEVAFRGTYVFANPDDVERRMRFTFAFPAEHAIYDDFNITVDGVSNHSRRRSRQGAGHGSHGCAPRPRDLRRQLSIARHR